MSKKERLKQLKKQIENELNCPLKESATNLVFGDGNAEAKVMFIGEAPGEKEDLEGIPFVGKAGKELDKLLYKIGLTRKDIYIANILKYRPPKNRDPKIDEIKRHTPYLLKQIKIIEPKVIVTLGNYSTKFVLGGFKPENIKNVEGISKLRGKPKKLKSKNYEFIVIPIYHPAAILYRPQLRKDFEKDFQLIKKFI